MKVAKEILREFNRKKYNGVITLLDLQLIAPQNTLRGTLKRLVDSGEIIRIAPGYYIKNEFIRDLGIPKRPSLNAVAEAYARTKQIKLFPTIEEIFCNTGICTQIPMQTAFGTTKENYVLKTTIGVIYFKRIPCRNISSFSQEHSVLALMLYFLAKNKNSSYTTAIMKFLAKFPKELLHKIAQRIGYEKLVSV